MNQHLQVDKAQIEHFVTALFRYADEGTYISLRAFDQTDRSQKVTIQAVKLNGGGLDTLITAATQAAQQSADAARGEVFAPPICTFNDAFRARGVDLANGLALSVEIDAAPVAGRRYLEQLIGPATSVVESGSTWTDPETGEIQSKVHLHWRLSEPTRNQEDHARLRDARGIAMRLVGADPTGVPIVHPLRWPGSWNVKGKPVLATISSTGTEPEIHLTDALDKLQDAQEQAGFVAVGIQRSSKPTADPALLRDAMATIPNAGSTVHYGEWIKLGYACWRAFGGDAGFDAWDRWSRKSDKYDAGETETAWSRISAACAGTNPPRTVGAGSIFFMAKAEGWRQQEGAAPDLHDDPGYVASIDAQAAAAATNQGETLGGDPGYNPLAWPSADMTIARTSITPAPAFPSDILPPGWAAWTAVAAEAAGTVPDYIAGVLLATAGALLGNARHGSPWPGWAEPPVLFVALIGRPSAGKSPAMSAIGRILDRMTADINVDLTDRQRDHATKMEEAKQHRTSWEADVKAAVKEGKAAPTMPTQATEPEPPHRRRFHSTEPTVAKAARLSAANPRGLLLFRDELAGWLGGMAAKDRGEDRAFWLQAWNGARWTPDRVKDGDREVSVANLTWGIVGGIQPDRVATMMLSGDDDGLAARFLPFWPEPRQPRRPDVALDEAWAVDCLSRLRSIGWAGPDHGLVRLSDAAAELLQEWRVSVAAMEGGAAGLFLSWTGKLPGFALRLATILDHLAWCETGRLDPPSEIGEVAMLRAITFLEVYAVPMARRAFGEAASPQAERDARRLARWLIRREPIPTKLNAREMRRMADGPGLADAGATNAALAELAEAGWVRRAPMRAGETPGRSRVDWEVNPTLQSRRHDMV